MEIVFVDQIDGGGIADDGGSAAITARQLDGKQIQIAFHADHLLNVGMLLVKLSDATAKVSKPGQHRLLGAQVQAGVVQGALDLSLTMKLEDDTELRFRIDRTAAIELARLLTALLAGENGEPMHRHS